MKATSQASLPPFVRVFLSDVSTSLPEECGDSRNYEDIFSALLLGEESEFFTYCWERRPALFRRQGPAVSASSLSTSFPLLEEVNKPATLFSKECLLSVVERFKLDSNNNFNVVRYNGITKEVLDLPYDEHGGRKQIVNAFKAGYTIQFFQPQRFSDMLFRVNASFENEFGTLAGASAYLTPSGTQGLAPHHDDVEVFILQLEGTKRWNLWDHSLFPSSERQAVPLPLPEHYSDDIDRNFLPPISKNVSLSESVLLKPGDLLYLPRGTIHEAVAQEQFSTHVTISVYQHYNYKAVISRMLQPLVEKAFSELLPFRHGLPRQLNRIAGSGAASLLSSDLNGLQKLGEQRLVFIESIKSAVGELPAMVTNELIDTAVDEIVSDFMASRLPPPNLVLPTKVPLNVVQRSECKNGKRSRALADDDFENKILLRELDDSYDRWRIKMSTDDDWNTSLNSALRNSEVSKPKKAKTMTAIGDIKLKMCSANTFHMETVDVDGDTMFSLTSSRFNSRLRHMGLTVPALIDDESGDNEDDESGTVESDGGSIGDKFNNLQNGKATGQTIGFEEDSVSSAEDTEGNTFAAWTVVLPLRLRPIVFSLLYHTANDGCILLKDLRDEMQCKHQIGGNEVVNGIFVRSG
jgi:hypothetical protein